jgi:hypothetical protein
MTDESSLKDMIEILALIVSNGHTECSDMLDCCVHHFLNAEDDEKKAFFAFANWDVWCIPPTQQPPITEEQFKPWFSVFLNLIEAEMVERLKLPDPFPEIKEKREKLADIWNTKGTHK